VNWLDIVVLIIVGYSTFAGLRRGFARAVVGIAATFLGIVFGFSFYGWVAAHVFGGMASREFAKLLGFLIVFGVFLLLGGIFARMLARLFKAIGLGWLDHLLGGAFGFVRGLIVVSVLVTVTLAFRPQSIEESKTLPYVIGASNALATITPKEVKDKFREAQENVKKLWSKKPA
jgi:membrane protein required for colicin V production